MYVAVISVNDNVPASDAGVYAVPVVSVSTTRAILLPPHLLHVFDLGISVILVPLQN